MSNEGERKQRYKKIKQLNKIEKFNTNHVLFNKEIFFNIFLKVVLNKNKVFFTSFYIFTIVV